MNFSEVGMNVYDAIQAIPGMFSVNLLALFSHFCIAQLSRRPFPFLLRKAKAQITSGEQSDVPVNEYSHGFVYSYAPGKVTATLDRWRSFLIASFDET